MGKAKAVKSPSKAAPVVPAEVQSQVAELRQQAQANFLKKEFAKATEAYDAAVKLLPDGVPDKVELMQKKVGCLMSLKKFKEAVKEATAVLEVAPNTPAALKSRAKAYEQQGLYKQALSDVQAVNRTDAATDDTREMEKRLKDTTSGRARPASANAAGSRATASPAHPYHLTIKASLGSESKLIYASLTVSYADLLDQVKSKFRSAGPVVLKYMDKDGDLVTVTSRQDIQTAVADLLVSFQRQLQGSHSPKLLQQQGLPPLKIVVLPVASEADVPQPPAAELMERAQAMANALQEQASQQQQQPPAPHYEPEEWIMDFVRLFTETTGLDPAAHFDGIQQAQETLQRAMLQTVHSEASEPLFDEAANHYRDAVVASYIQWGNVHIIKADRLLQNLIKGATDNSWTDGAGVADVLAQYDLTESKVRDALAVHPKSWEAIGSLAQLEWERAKAKMGYVLPQLPSDDKAADGADNQQAAVSKQLAEVLSRISKEKAAEVKPHIDKCGELFSQALELAKEAQAAKDAKKAKQAADAKAKEAAAGSSSSSTSEEVAAPAAAAEANGEAAAAFSTAPSNVLIMHGNILYDWSQVLATTGLDEWRPLLDDATAKFRQSGAPESDVRNALKNHIRKDDLDLGPDPEPEAAAPAAAPPAAAAGEPAAPAAPAAADKKAPEAAKGLPSLDIKKSAAAAAAPKK